MKKVASILLSAAMLLSTAACSAGGTDSKPSDSTTDGEKESKDITFSIFIDHPWFWHDKWGEDPVSQEITKRTGVSLDITRVVDDQQLGILISGGDLPDLVYTSTQATMTLLSDPNVCYSYNELVEKTGVDIHATEDVIRNNTAKDGNYYSLLNAFTSQEDFSNGKAIAGGTKTIAYRTDIYEAIGSPELNTLEDLENALLASKEKFPDVIPLLNDATCLWYFAEQLGVNGSYQVGYDKDGNPCHFLHEDGIEEYFKLLNRFAREGLISAEAQTYNFDKYSEVRNSGGAFMQLRSSDEATVANNAAKQAGTDYRWQLLTNDLGGEDTIALVITNVGWSGTFITKNCSDPERAIEFMSWCRSEEGRKLTAWGIEGKDWEYNDEGLTVTTEEYRQSVSEGSYTSQYDDNNLIHIFRRAGYYTASVSSFSERHSSYWFHAGFNETYNCGGMGWESGEKVYPYVAQWLDRNRDRDNWFLHVHFWDPHTPYRAPKEFGEPFEDAPMNTWLTEETIAEHRKLAGPHGANEVNMYNDAESPDLPRQPGKVHSLADYRRLTDGYDTGIRYTDELVGKILDQLRENGQYEDTAIIITSDHGENLGELGIYCEHATADHPTCHIPFIIKWPGLAQNQVNTALHYHLDLLPTLAELLQVERKDNWDGESYLDELRGSAEKGRPYLVLSQMSHVCQRSVRFDHWLYMRTYHDGYHLFDREMLFDLREDPYEQKDVKEQYPEICGKACRYLLEWHDDQMHSSISFTDPLWQVIHEGGPIFAKGHLQEYIKRLEQTGRKDCAEKLRAKKSAVYY